MTLKLNMSDTVVRKSLIHGDGLFGTKPFAPGDFITVLYDKHLNYSDDKVKRTNHQYDSNSILRRDHDNDDYRLYASKYIPIGQEIVLNYNTSAITMSPMGYDSFLRGEWIER